VFDIGGPEFLVIAVVALVVLGPERLPEVMRRAGVFYRQARQMLDQYTGEAQRMFEEGMREVNEVSNSISTTWQDATAEATPDAPPPALLQLPPPRLAPEKAAAAGPWVLPAWYRDSRADLEPRSKEYPLSPFVLEPPRAEDADLFDDFGIGGPSLMGPAPTEDDAGWAIPALADEPRDREPVPAGVAGPTDHVPAAERAAPQPVRPAAALPEPALGIADEGALFATSEDGAPTPTNGTSRHAPDRTPDAETVRQETLIELYRTGDVTLEKAAEFLGITPAQFRGLLKRK
jgi:Tat protein translocase TatB subunit